LRNSSATTSTEASLDEGSADAEPEEDSDEGDVEDDDGD
jgi:hypothetical protein